MDSEAYRLVKRTGLVQALQALEDLAGGPEARERLSREAEE